MQERRIRKEPQSVPLLLSLYKDYLKHRTLQIYARRVESHYAPATLERMAKTGDCQCRRAAVIALGLLGDYESNPIMGAALLDADRGVRRAAEKGITQVWQRMGSQKQRTVLRTIIQLNQQGHCMDALSLASELIEQTPWFSEAWNQRARAYYDRKFYTDSIRDCCRTLEINPFHFESAVRMGHSHVELDDLISALDCYHKALNINPNLEGVRAKVIYLRKSLGD